MKNAHRHDGFSLTEILIALGVLTVGFLFVAGSFPVAIHFSTIATQRTMSAVIVDEAFAKINLFGLPGSFSLPVGYNYNSFIFRHAWESQTDPLAAIIDSDEFRYPSVRDSQRTKHYSWSALCRRLDPDPNDTLYLVTVFVSRKGNLNLTYLDLIYGSQPIPMPIPVEVRLAQTNPSAPVNELVIINPAEYSYINDGYTIVDDATGEIYRVMERFAEPQSNIIQLDRPWQGYSTDSFNVWVVPPAINSGKYPVIEVFQRLMRLKIR